MAIPNNTPNDSGRKSLAAHVWQTRRTVSRGGDKPKKDFWDVADIILKAVVAILVAFVGWKLQESIATQNTGPANMQMALNILERKDQSQEIQKNLGLRKWAVGLLKYYSPVTLDDGTADKLVNGQVDIGSIVYSDLQSHSSQIPDLSTKGIQAPHGIDLIAVLSADGTLRLSPFKTKQFPAYIYHTGIKAPNSVTFSEDASKLLVSGSQTLMLFVSFGRTPEGLPRFKTPAQITPPNGIISFSDDGIIITGDNGKETRYDSDGNEIK